VIGAAGRLVLDKDYSGSRSVRILLVGYGASTATTTLPCVVYILNKSSEVTGYQLMVLLSSYVPFMVIPLVMAVDMGLRLAKEGERKVKGE
jgi:hypothetical protein